MPLSEAQKRQFVALLQAKGWELRDGTIWAPKQGLWFDDSHFEWSPLEIHDIFTRRAARIAKAGIGDWQSSSRQNEEAAWAAAEVARL